MGLVSSSAAYTAVLYNFICTCIQLTLEQQRFELLGSTYIWAFFSKYIVGPLYPGFTSATGNPQMWRVDCVHCSMPFYLRDLESAGISPLQRPRNNYS